MVKTIPPKISIDDNIKRILIDSEIKISPPNAAITGTESCTIDATVVDIFRSTIYQRIYPKPEVIAPETTARKKPLSL